MTSFLLQICGLFNIWHMKCVNMQYILVINVRIPTKKIHVNAAFYISSTTNRGFWIFFFDLRLYAACLTHFMCHDELWPSSDTHLFPFLSSSLGLAGGKHYQKILCCYLPKFGFAGCFPYILCYSYQSCSSLWWDNCCEWPYFSPEN